MLTNGRTDTVLYIIIYHDQGEVEDWEDKNRSIKEELSKLETQRKGLEAILRKHNSGSCKVVKKEGISQLYELMIQNNFDIFS